MPHTGGGVWERIIGMFKRHLACVLSGEIQHIETFTTMIVEIEGVLNRRPLTAVSSDSRDSEALTPNHLLAPASVRADTNVISVIGAPDAKDTKEAWKRAQSGVNSFWKKWRTEYLALLHQRQKWTGSKENLKVNDIVIIVEAGVHRNEWSLGRVLKTLQSDEHVRTVEVRRSDGKVLTRDRTKIVKLELEE